VWRSGEVAGFKYDFTKMGIPKTFMWGMRLVYEESSGITWTINTERLDSAPADVGTNHLDVILEIIKLYLTSLRE
jgi:hypothetical protein